MAILTFLCCGKNVNIANFNYRPQTKFSKVMFLQVCVCPQVGSTWAGTPPEPGTPPRTRYTPPGPGTPSGTRYTPWDQVHPPGTRYTPQAVHAGRYGQQVGGTHPTGMHSCLAVLFEIEKTNKVYNLERLSLLPTDI